jgi:hypothetical protein
MTKQRLWLALLVPIATLASIYVSCSKQNIGSFLPPETQTGAGTFACLINGEVWTYKDPTDFFTLKPTTYVEYNPNYKGGTLEIGGLRYNDKNSFVDRLDLFTDSLQFKKEFVLKSQPYSANLYICYSDPCNDQCTLPPIPNSFRQGKITITKLDTTKGIIAGKFDCKIFKPGCDTLRITEGRFDFRIK